MRMISRRRRFFIQRSTRVVEVIVIVIVSDKAVQLIVVTARVIALIEKDGIVILGRSPLELFSILSSLVLVAVITHDTAPVQASAD